MNTKFVCSTVIFLPLYLWATLQLYNLIFCMKVINVQRVDYYSSCFYLFLVVMTQTFVFALADFVTRVGLEIVAVTSRLLTALTA